MELIPLIGDNGHIYFCDSKGDVEILSLCIYDIDIPGGHYLDYALYTLIHSSSHSIIPANLCACHCCGKVDMCYNVNVLTHDICSDCLVSIYDDTHLVEPADDLFVQITINPNASKILKVFESKIYIYMYTKIEIDNLLAIWDISQYAAAPICVICRRAGIRATCSECDKMCACMYARGYWLVIPALLVIVPRDVIGLIVYYMKN